MNKLLFLFLLIGFLTACSSGKTWVVKRWQNGGVIGYIGDRHNIYKEIQKKAHCDNFRIVANHYKSTRHKLDLYIDKKRRVDTETGYYIKESRKNDSSSHDYTDQFWREFTYRCYYHPHYDYATGEDLSHPEMSFYNRSDTSSILPYCHDYYGNHCAPANH